MTRAKHLIADLQPGLTLLILHPAQDTPELRTLAPDWPSRVANYHALLSPDLRAHIRQAGVQVIGYRPLRDLLRRTPRLSATSSGLLGVAARFIALSPYRDRSSQANWFLEPALGPKKNNFLERKRLLAPTRKRTLAPQNMKTAPPA